MAARTHAQKVKELSQGFAMNESGLLVPSRDARLRQLGVTRGHGGGVGASYAGVQPVRLPVEHEPKREIADSLYHARLLAEIAQWSIEAVTAVTTISRDVFMSSDGSLSSWSVAGIPKQDDETKREKLNADTQAVVRDLQQRRYGKQYVVGGFKFQRAINEMLRYGDSFVQLRLKREGLSSAPSDWCVAETHYLHPLDTFVLEDELERETGYRRMLDDTTDVEDYGLLEVLHFCHQQNGHYGTSAFLAMLPTWESLKREYPAVESAVIDTGVAPWLHKMFPGATEEDRAVYEDQHTNLCADGIPKNLYLMPGASVEKAANNSAGAQELIMTWLEMRRSMIPFGLPDYFFSLPSRANAQAINLQPAMLYARTIAGIRSMVAEQIKWVLDIEIALKLGIDHLKNNPYDIVWPKWQVQEVQEVVVNRESGGE
jgi:hypothetical protein